jgi:hypothetical protein
MAYKIIVLFWVLFFSYPLSCLADSNWGTMVWGQDNWYLDTDNDGITDTDELQIYGTEPNIADTDGDGLNDGSEVAYWGVDWNADPDEDQINNLLDYDSDNDGLSDGVEVNILGTDPSLTDSDGNGILDGNEDNDGDGFTNAEETICGSDPADPNSKCTMGLPFLMLLLD